MQGKFKFLFPPARWPFSEMACHSINWLCMFLCFIWSVIFMVLKCAVKEGTDLNTIGQYCGI